MVQENIDDFIEMLIDTDKTMKTLKTNFNELK